MLTCTVAAFRVLCYSNLHHYCDNKMENSNYKTVCCSSKYFNPGLRRRILLPLFSVLSYSTSPGYTWRTVPSFGPHNSRKLWTDWGRSRGGPQGCSMGRRNCLMSEDWRPYLLSPWRREGSSGTSSQYSRAATKRKEALPSQGATWRRQRGTECKLH